MTLRKVMGAWWGVVALLAGGGCYHPTSEDAGSNLPVAPKVVIQPGSLDFGKVLVPQTVTKSVLVTNSSGGNVGVTIGQLQGADAALFTLMPPAGSVIALADKEAVSVTVVYAPVVVAATPSQASFSLQICSNGATGCAPAVSLLGSAVTPALTAMPSPLDFGFVPTHRTAMRTVTLTNGSAQTVQLTSNPAVVTKKADGSATVPNVFSLPSAPPAGTKLLPGAAMQIAVDFSPTSTAAYLGELDVVTDDPANPGTRVQLAGTGGGPTISCAPPQLDFGINTTGIPTVMHVVCTNVGQSLAGHPETNLQIPDPNSQTPGLTILNGDRAFQAAFDQPFPLAGLAAGESIQIDVTYQAVLAGKDDDFLVVNSNDTLNPQTQIALSGSALALFPCTAQILPALGIAFGRVKVGTQAVLPFEIVNNFTATCLIDEMQLAPGSASAFSLPDYPGNTTPAQTLNPGDRLEVKVQFAPTTADEQFAGTVTFRRSNPTSPQQSVSLSGSSLTGCLAFGPAAVDFGLVGSDPTVIGQYCKNGAQTLTVWNLCTQDIVVSDIQVLDNLSQFWLGSTLQLPITVPAVCTTPPCTAVTPTTVPISFFPAQAGTHLAGLAITATDLPDPYLVTLQGGAAQSQTRTDTFTGYPASIDVLWVLDSAATDVTTNLSTFLSFADQLEIDYQMATTTTDLFGGAGSEDGRMEPCPGCKKDGTAIQVVTSSQGAAGASQALSPLLELGTWSCMNSPNPNNLPCDRQLLEATYEALSPTLLQSSGYNQPFYRPNAFLAVIVVTSDLKDDLSAARDLGAYYDAFLAVKGPQQANRFSFNRVSTGAGVGSTQRLALMTQMTGGIDADVQQNWPDNFNAFWSNVDARIHSYPLSGTPDVSTIRVTAGGLPISSALWTYDLSRHVVQFDPLGFPQPGDQVDITYTLGCGF